MPSNLGAYEYFHDYICDRVMVSEESGIELRCTSPDRQHCTVLRFRGVEEFQFVDLALGNILCSIREIGFEDLEKLETDGCPPFSDSIAAEAGSGGNVRRSVFCAYSKRDIQRVIQDLSETKRKNLRLWLITPSYGLQAVILANELEAKEILRPEKSVID
jgi:hypothetical protein